MPHLPEEVQVDKGRFGILFSSETFIRKQKEDGKDRNHTVRHAMGPFSETQNTGNMHFWRTKISDHQKNSTES